MNWFYRLTGSALLILCMAIVILFLPGVIIGNLSWGIVSEVMKIGDTVMNKTDRLLEGDEAK